MQSIPAWAIRIPALFLLSLLAACSTVYKTTGDILINFAEDEMVPYLMTTSDTEMGCAAGESLTPLLMGFSSVGSDTDKVAALIHTVAGLCNEQRAFENELRYLRAVRNQNADEAKDARIAQKRHHANAALRQLAAYNYTVAAFGEPTEGYCPKLKADFDQMVWIVGLVAGVQAITNDMASGSQIGVPKNIPAMVQRGAACVDNEAWWGLPRGVSAAVWSILPQLAPEGVDVWAELEKSRDVGNQKGVRLGAALFLIASAGQGDEQRVRDILRNFAATDTRKLDPDFRMLDALAASYVDMASDRIWTRLTGARTPVGKLGQFPDEKAKTDESDIADFL